MGVTDAWAVGQAFSIPWDADLFAAAAPPADPVVTLPMPLARVIVRFVGTQAGIANAVSFITGRYPATGRIFDREDGGDRLLDSGLFGRCLDIRLKGKADGDAVQAALVANLASISALGVSGKVTYHQCSHTDTNPVECVPTEWTI